MFGLQPWHLLAILGIALIVFGPARLPELGNAIGRSLREFRDAASGVQEEFKKSLDEPTRAESDSVGSQETRTGRNDAQSKE